jgi:hypothetical protein
MPEEKVDHRETVAHMVSEFFREIAALILVFVPLDYLLKGDHVGPNFGSEAIAVVIVSGLLLISGIVIERKFK